MRLFFDQDFYLLIAEKVEWGVKYKTYDHAERIANKLLNKGYFNAYNIMRVFRL